MSAGEWVVVAMCVFYAVLALALFAANHANRRPIRLDSELDHMHRADQP